MYTRFYKEVFMYHSSLIHSNQPAYYSKPLSHSTGNKKHHQFTYLHCPSYKNELFLRLSLKSQPVLESATLFSYVIDFNSAFRSSIEAKITCRNELTNMNSIHYRSKQYHSTSEQFTNGRIGFAEL